MKSSLNLMSEHSQKRVQVRRSLRLWSRLILAVVIVLAVRGTMQWQKYSTEGQRQTVAELDYEPLEKLEKESVKLRKQINQFQETERVALALSKEEHVLGLIGLVSQAIAESDDNIYLQQIEIQRDPLALASTNSPNLIFTLSGSTIDSVAVKTLEDNLRKLGPFDAVDLKTSPATRLGKITQQSFSLKCTN